MINIKYLSTFVVLKKILLHPLFLVGLTVRLIMIFNIQPSAAIDWYIPFMDSNLSSFSLDPWQQWFSQKGSAIAFPYGYVMWISLLPITAVFKLIGLPLIYAYGLTLLIVDFCILALLRQFRPNSDKLILVVYWLSPIVLLATYYLGFNDLIPVFFLLLSVYYTRQLRLFAAGLFCVMAISAKLSMVLALPFFLIYLFQNKALRQLLPQFLQGLSLALLLFCIPFLLSPSALNMLLNNPEMGKVYAFSLSIGNNTSLYIVPLVYLVMVYATWRVHRLNFELFQSTLGLTFLLLVLLTPSSPGWFIWAMPLLVLYQVRGGRIAIILCSIFSVLYVINTMFSIHSSVGIQSSNLVTGFKLSSQSTSLLNTLITAIGVILAIRIWRETISLNDYFRLSRKPFVIGIAGDSGSGKDTFSDAITGLFGDHSVTKLQGDDYHLWDRNKPMWQAMTHLNPLANDLENFANDLVNLSDGKTIFSRHYDHHSGKMSRPLRIKSNDFIIANGLHALYHPILRENYSLSIYLNMDDDLRRHFKLQRDVNLRGHSLEKVLSSFTRRGPDAECFIRPQAEHADLLLSLKPIHPGMLDDASHKTLRLKLLARSRNGLSEISLKRALIGVCGLHVDMTTQPDTGEVELCIEGETCAEDIELAAKMLCPRILEFVDIAPKWQDGVIGLMQLITLSHINQALTKRFI